MAAMPSLQLPVQCATAAPIITSRRPRTSRRANSSSTAISRVTNHAYGSGNITPRPPQQPNDRSPANGGVTHRGPNTARQVTSSDVTSRASRARVQRDEGSAASGGVTHRRPVTARSTARKVVVSQRADSAFSGSVTHGRPATARPFTRSDTVTPKHPPKQPRDDRFSGTGTHQRPNTARIFTSTDAVPRQIQLDESTVASGSVTYRSPAALSRTSALLSRLVGDPSDDCSGSSSPYGLVDKQMVSDGGEVSDVSSEESPTSRRIGKKLHREARELRLTLARTQQRRASGRVKCDEPADVEEV